jgi:hypothetical protein
MDDDAVTIATIGLHGSASTWVFNVVRELVIAVHGEDRVLAVYADTEAQVPDDSTRRGRHLVIKSHQGSGEFDAWLAATRVPLILSVRDPRDAAMSMSQRFGVPLAQAVGWLVQDCNRMIRLAAGNHTLLRYEDRFFDDIVWTRHLAATLGLAVDEATMGAIFARYCTDAVRTFGQGIAQLDPERVIVTQTSRYDRVTHIHDIHIGDTRSRKWRDLPVPTQVEMAHMFVRFLLRFGY